MKVEPYTTSASGDAEAEYCPLRRSYVHVDICNKCPFKRLCMEGILPIYFRVMV